MWNVISSLDCAAVRRRTTCATLSKRFFYTDCEQSSATSRQHGWIFRFVNNLLIGTRRLEDGLTDSTNRPTGPASRVQYIDRFMSHCVVCYVSSALNEVQWHSLKHSWRPRECEEDATFYYNYYCRLAVVTSLRYQSPTGNCVASHSLTHSLTGPQDRHQDTPVLKFETWLVESVSRVAEYCSKNSPNRIYFYHFGHNFTWNLN